MFLWGEWGEVTGNFSKYFTWQHPMNLEALQNKKLKKIGRYGLIYFTLFPELVLQCASQLLPSNNYSRIKKYIGIKRKEWRNGGRRKREREKENQCWLSFLFSSLTHWSSGDTTWAQSCFVLWMKALALEHNIPITLPTANQMRELCCFWMKTHPFWLSSSKPCMHLHCHMFTGKIKNGILAYSAK